MGEIEQQIKAEIERLKEVGCPLQKGSDYQHGYDEFYTQIKKFIDSLPSEESSEQLCWNDMTEEEKSDFFFNLSHQIQIEKPSEDLEEELDNYCVHGDIRNPNFEGPFGYDDIRKTAIHFADWQKEQTINKASKWLADNVIHYIWKSSKGEIGISDDFFIDFEKAMEEKNERTRL